MDYQDGEILDTGITIFPNYSKVRIQGERHYLGTGTDKFFVRACPICDEAAQNGADGRVCNGCVYRCGRKPLFIKVYTGSEKEIQKSMKNQGESQFCSPYIAKTFGYKEKEDACYVIMEYVEGDDLGHLPDILGADKKKNLSEREKALIKYKLIRQMLLGVQDYQYQSGTEAGGGVHLDLKPQNFVLTCENEVKDIRVKLTDFEGYTRRNGKMNAFVSSAAYAHPAQLQCFRQGTAPIQVEVTWDFYALGIIIYEMLEEKPFFEEEEVKKRKEEPFSLEKKAEFRKFSQYAPKKEAEYMQAMLEKMMDLESPWKNTEEILAYFENMLDKCLETKELAFIQGKEYLNIGERLLIEKPYIHIEIEVCTGDYALNVLVYDLMQGSAIPWYYGINFWGHSEDRESGPAAKAMIGCLYECNGAVRYFPVAEPDTDKDFEAPLLQNDAWSYGDVNIRVLNIEKYGYGRMGKTLKGRRRI